MEIIFSFSAFLPLDEISSSLLENQICFFSVPPRFFLSRNFAFLPFSPFSTFYPFFVVQIRKKPKRYAFAEPLPLSPNPLIKTLAVPRAPRISSPASPELDPTLHHTSFHPITHTPYFATLPKHRKTIWIHIPYHHDHLLPGPPPLSSPSPTPPLRHASWPRHGCRPSVSPPPAAAPSAAGAPRPPDEPAPLPTPGSAPRRGS